MHRILPQGSNDIAGRLHIACPEQRQGNHTLHKPVLLQPSLLDLLPVIIDGRKYIAWNAIIVEHTPHIQILHRQVPDHPVSRSLGPRTGARTPAAPLPISLEIPLIFRQDLPVHIPYGRHHHRIYLLLQISRYGL
jgi:hypothetical protein